MVERKKPKITHKPPNPSSSRAVPACDPHVISGLLDGKDKIQEFLGVSEYMLNKFLAAGMPVLIDNNRWLAHADNLEDFFRKYTRVDSRSKAIEIQCQAK